jgi:nitroreductase
MLLKDIINNFKTPLEFDINFKIEKEDILMILEAGRWAPSAENQQVWRFIAIDGAEMKKIVIESVKKQDPRLLNESNNLIEPILKSSFIFSKENFDSKTDKYKDNILESYIYDLKCANTASFFIISAHKDNRLGRIFGFTDIGGSLTNMILLSKNLGYSVRLIRNFNRDIIREKLNIHESFFVDHLLAIGKPVKESEKTELANKNYEDFYFHNQWGNPLKISEFKEEDSSFQDYDVEVVDPIVDRRSVRSYFETKDIADCIKFELIKAGMIIPLTINKPYIKIILIDDKNLIKDFAKNSKFVIQQSHVKQVPLIVAITYDCSNNSPAFYAETDTGAIIQSMILRAHSLGIGSCWIGAFSRRATKEILEIEGNWKIPSVAIFGYPKKYPKPTPRLSLGKIGYYNLWDVPIEKEKRSLIPNDHFLSIASRKFRNTRVKTILRNRKVGNPIGIPEFEELL